ncbi:hypothetical protein [Labedaea rhizosphaerae]|uniref:Uncharacterized protein n=1 Tax=Labedaea rhizosphaerae TaxID=598644 RepID=A0A4R6SF65_LABRH|nr:hypothetical protein [Labedaea rhizosphaerae]TDQ00140.1 hypothetical protein EV186_1021 [Labedaea rhizosphaerae]
MSEGMFEFMTDQLEEERRTEAPPPAAAQEPSSEPQPTDESPKAENGESDRSHLWDLGSTDSSDSSRDDYSVSSSDDSSGGGSSPFSAMVSAIAGWFSGAAAAAGDDLVEPNLTDFSDPGVHATPLGRVKEAEQREQRDAELQKIAAFNEAEKRKDTEWRKQDDPIEDKTTAQPIDEAGTSPGQPENTWVEDDLVGGAASPAATPSEEPDKTWVEDALQIETISRAKNTYMDTFREAVTEVVASAKEAVRQEIQGVRQTVEAAKDQYTNLTMTVQEAEAFLSGKVEGVVQQRFAALDDPHVQIDDFMPIMLNINKTSVAPKEAAKTVKDVLSGAITAKDLVLDQFSPFKFLEDVTKDEGCTEALVVLFRSYDENKRVETIADFVINALKGLEDMVDMRSQVD